MANIENLKAFDPFADAAKGDDESVQDGLVHVRIQQRNGRKTLTSVQVGGGPDILIQAVSGLWQVVVEKFFFPRASPLSMTSRRLSRLLRRSLPAMARWWTTRSMGRCTIQNFFFYILFTLYFTFLHCIGFVFNFCCLCYLILFQIKHSTPEFQII